VGLGVLGERDDSVTVHALIASSVLGLLIIEADANPVMRPKRVQIDEVRIVKQDISAGFIYCRARTDPHRSVMRPRDGKSPYYAPIMKIQIVAPARVDMVFLLIEKIVFEQ
jgi:hypothetical protein